MFNQLQLWHDYNQDATVQEGELKNLKDEGVNSIDLNYVSTRIEINGNLLTEASKYSTDSGTKELVADIQLATDVADTKVDLSDIPNFTVDESTRSLPGLKGSGLVYDAFILYNTNNEFKALSEVLASDSVKAFNDFGSYLEQWSGYTKYVTQLKEKYSLADDFTMQEGDKQAWIIDRFSAKDDSTTTIQNYYNTNLNNGKIPQTAIINTSDINTTYTALLERTQSSFILLTHLKDLFSDTHYDSTANRFVIDDVTVFNAKIDGYLNSADHTIEEKLRVASMMQMQREGLNFDIDTIIGGIDNSITKTLVRDVYSDKGIAFLSSQSVDESGVVIGSDNDDLVIIGDTNAKMLLGSGNDIVQSGKGHNTFFFYKGDGADVISDTGGIDSLIFDTGITRNDVEIRLNRNADLVIALKEAGKTFEELTDKITIVDWMKASNRIEEICFGDGSQLKFKEVLALFAATDDVDVLQLSTGNDIIDGKGGNDVITALMGNDTITGGQGSDRLDGGVGNDTYIYSRGDGKDTIIDSGGYDTLQFTAGITNDNLIAKLQGSDLLIALKEEGKTFAELSDVITLKNYKNEKETIEAIFLEGYQRVDIEQLLNAPTNENDRLELGEGDDTIDMLEGDDTLFAGAGDDTIIGGKGSDDLQGGLGNDTYIYNRGDGNDTIYDDSSFGYQNSRKENAGNDTLRFGEGITQEDLIIQYSGPDLIIALKEEGKVFEELSDTILIQNYTDTNNKIENILFSDGSNITINGIKNGTDGNDTLNFKDATEDLVLQGLRGRDFIHGGSGDDVIQGNSGTDDLYGGAGDDTIIGGQESDFLAGGAGNDTYVFNRGDGVDVILDDNRPEYESFGSTNIKVDRLLKRMEIGDTAQVDAGYDTLKFGAGITREDISYEISGNNLQIHIAGGTNDSITIVNYLSTKNRVENILLDDGTTIDLFAATQGDDKLVFGDTNTIIDALGGDDIVSTGSGSDTITGGAGNDRLEAGAGNDTYIYRRGDGKDTIIDTIGDDTLKLVGGLSQADVIIRLIGKDLVVALKEVGKSFDALSDVILIKNYTNSANAMETIIFEDGSSIDLATFDFGTDANDNFIFGNTNNIINAKGGDDVVSTGAGNDIITGGTGRDTLGGGAGNDSYIYRRGDGKDTITDAGGNDTLKFVGGLTQNDVIVKLIGKDLVVALKEEGKTFDTLSDVITVKNYTNSANAMEAITFEDGSSIDLATFDFGTETNDYFLFGASSTDLDAKGGDDIVSTGAGNDTISGGAGDDILKSGAGQDTLSGGLGNDTLEGGRENDTYVFNRGNGHDTILDAYHGYSVDGGMLEFDTNPNTGELIVKVSGSVLISSIQAREKSFSSFATNVTDTDKNSINSDDIFIKIIGNDLIIARIQNGTFIDWSNKITYHAYLSENGSMEFGEGSAKGNLSAGMIDGNLVLGMGAEDPIIFHSKANSGNDTLKFGEGISKEDILYKSVGNDLIFGLKEEGKQFDELTDTVTIKNYVSANNKIENIRLSDGTLFDFDSTPVATEGDDNLVFVGQSVTVDLLGGNDIVTTDYGNDMIFAGEGDDTVYSRAGHDAVNGGSGNDKLYTGAGNDTVVGNTGDDILDGGAGNDIYHYARGDGKDTINDSAGSDTIVFDSGISSDDLMFRQDDFDLVIGLKDGVKTIDELSDQMVIKNWFKKDTNIEEIKFADGSGLSATQIATMLMDSDPDTLYSNHGAVMRGGKGDDTYVYKKDDFTVIIDDQFMNKEIVVNAGNDTLKFEDINKEQVTIGTKGDDLVIKINASHDTYTELKDYVLIRDWKNPNRGIEQIVFGDGEILIIDKTAIYPALEFDENWIKGHYYVYGSENDVIEGSNDSETIESGAGNDSVNTFDGNDLINAGTGDDTLDGGKGNDTYIFNRGDGIDTINDFSGVDAIKFGNGVSQSDILLERVNNDLIVALKIDGKTLDELSDKIIMKEWFNEDTIEYRVELMAFGNESVAIADIVTAPTQNDDDLEYGDEKNRINALDGDDIIHIGGGNDTLMGNAGNDRLYGEEGDDLIGGDQGNDLLYGADGDDTYLFGRGDGNDTIVEDDFAIWGQSGNDTLNFKDGITVDDLILVQNGDDLIVALKEDGKTFDELADKITLQNWSLYYEENSRDLSRAYYTIENFSFSDGTKWSMSDITAHIGTDDDETIHGFNQNDTLNAQAGDDTLHGYLGDDTYVFDRGSGQDIIYDYGRLGDNYSYYNGGVDTLKFGEGIIEDDLIILKDNDDVIIYVRNGDQTISELTDKVTIKNWFISNNRVENMALFDGTKIDYTKYLTADPTMEDDKLIYGSDDNYVDALSGDDIVISLGGNNFIDGNSGNDSIQTADGSDTLLGGEGDDTLDGGAGEDRLEGGSGNDTYIFGRGDWHNTIYDESGVDNLKFDASITQDDLVLFQDGRNLIVAIKENGVDIANATDKIIIVNWLDAETRLETITFTDDIVWDVATIVSKTGTEKDDTISGTELDDYLKGGEGDDTYVFERGGGHDTIYDYSGIDTLSFGEMITIDDLVFEINGNTLFIGLKEYGKDFSELTDVIALEDMLTQNNWIENFSFAGDKTYTSQEMYEYFYNKYADNIYHGGDEDDVIYGSYSDDILIGERGDDILYGGLGNDTYIFNREDGQDTIFDEGSSWADGGVNYGDVIKFGEGIGIDDIEVIKTDGNDLQIIIGSHQADEDSTAGISAYIVAAPQDSILIKRWYKEYAIETMQFADGSQYNIAEYFNVSLGTYSNPIVLDLNHNGMTSTALEISNAYFDYDGDGNREHTAWMEAGDAQLVVDINYDGIINNGSEIFGEHTKLPDGTLAQNGYEALIQYDSNSDGVIDSRDEAFGNLLLWKDSNQNGKSEDGELTNIQTSGILALHLNQENGITFEQSSENGNIILNETSYVSLNGSGIMRDVGFAYNPFDTIANNDTLTKEYYGNLLSGGDGDDTYIFNLGDGKIVVDDKGNGEDTLSFGNAITKEQLIVKWVSGSDDLLIGIRDSIYDNRAFSGLENQILIKNFFNDSGSIEKVQFKDTPSLNKSDLYNILINTRETKNLTARVLNKDGILEGGDLDDLLYGSNGEEKLEGKAGNDYLKGMEEDDLLIGGDDDDVLVGGKGDDTLQGDTGNDYYIYSKEDGRDLITDFGGNDTIALGDGIVYEDLIIEQKEDGLLITFEYDKEKDMEDRDAIFISDYGYGIFDIENIELANGESYKIKHFFNQAPILEEESVSVMLQDIRQQSGQVEATDADGDVLNYTVSTQAGHGTLSVDARGEWIYSVDGTYIGADFAVITVDDAQGGSVTKTLNFDAKVSNPTINTSTLNLQEDTSAVGTLSVTNPIGGALTYEILSGSSNAEFILNSEGNFSYTPSANYNGRDLIEVKVTNEYGLSSTAILNFEIEAVNDAPILLNSDAESYTLQNVREVDGIIEAEDIDGDTLNYTITTAATQGTFSVDTNGNWNYKADASFNGNDSATITIDDGNGGSAQKVLNFSREGYIYDGADLIIEDNGSDILVMDSVSKNDLTFVHSADDLEILVNEQGKITLKNYFTNIDAGVATLQTAQGDINLSKDVIKNAQQYFWNSSAKATDARNHLLIGSNRNDSLTGESGNDTLFGGSYNDYLYGKDGNDLLIGGEGNDNLYGDAGNDNIYGDAGSDNLYGGYGNDALIGGVGNDTLYAEEGDDFLSGGKGEDYLRGGLGNDTYFFSKGDDKDTVYDSKPSSSFLWFDFEEPNGGEDKIVFAKDVSKEDVSFYMKSGDLFLQYAENDSLIIKNQDNESSQIEKIELSDGNYLTNDDIDLVVQQINAYGSQNGMWHIDNQTIQNNVELMNIVSSAWRA
ncbi:MAG: calcium-binding protein [Sulfurimonas sp.]|uniref:calcium-binding protein n=1 Tax=Sulfurimonas sp. TaxID=2022749 RepID=UPI003D0BA81D